MSFEILEEATTRSMVLRDLREQRVQAVQLLQATLGESATYDPVTGLVSLSLDALIGLVQCTECKLPVTAGFEWVLQANTEPAPSNVVAALPLQESVVFDLPTVPSTAYLVSTTP